MLEDDPVVRGAGSSETLGDIERRVFSVPCMPPILPHPPTRSRAPRPELLSSLLGRSSSCLVSAHDHILGTNTHRGQPLKGHASDVPGDLANPGARVPAEKTLKRRCALGTRRPARTIQDMIAAGSRVIVRDQIWQLTEVEQHAMGGRAVMRCIDRDELIRDCRAFAVRRTGCDEPSGRSQRRAIMTVSTLSRSLALLHHKRTRRAGE